MKKKLIELYADGIQLNEFNKNYGIEIDGYTFNPSIFKKSGAKDYLTYSKEIISKCKTKPVSLEVISDEEIGMVNQAKILHSLSKNIFVKIPITFTNKEFTTKVLEQLVSENIKLNIPPYLLTNKLIKFYL